MSDPITSKSGSRTRRRSLAILVLGVMVAAAVYAWAYFAGTRQPRQWMASDHPELQWLKHEFQLGDAEFARITTLHDAYLPQCEFRCRRIEEMNSEFERLLSSASEITPELQSLLQNRARMRADCQAEMLQHFFQVSQAMPPEQGQRYLAWVREMTCLRESPVRTDHGADAHGAHH